MAEAVSVVIEGVQQAARDLLQLVDDNAQRELADAYRAAAQAIAIAAARKAPRRSTASPHGSAHLPGFLAFNVKPSSGKDWGKVKVSSRAVPYAGAVHFGWPKRNIRPQPFVWSAADELRLGVETIIAGVVDRLAEIAASAT